ncbi:hypothetical protein BJX99DRAFT_222842 [Aspergillus californicus]
MSESREMEEIIMEVFVARRRRLIELAEKNLPERLQHMLDVGTGCLPGMYAWEICEGVNARGHPVDLEIKSDRLVYHNWLRVDHIWWALRISTHHIRTIHLQYSAGLGFLEGWI